MHRRRFENLWQRCSNRADPAVFGARYDEVKARYCETHRRYHTPVHIGHCLQQFDAARELMDNANAVELAVWYHDVVYDIGVNDNEARSAELFVRHARGDLSEEMIETVCDLIMATMHLCKLPATIDQAYLVDIDLSSFGLPWERFLPDSAAVREEFPGISDEEFYPNQQEFLSALLSREHFCFTEFFRERHESQARDNISTYLQKLREKGLV